MSKKIAQLRRLAYARQCGKCFYCGLPMALHKGELPAFASSYHLTIRSAHNLTCTAEHLHARCEGGQDTEQNIVAACWFCNTRRHKRQVPLAPDAHRDRVSKAVSKGRWHNKELLERVLSVKSQIGRQPSAFPFSGDCAGMPLRS